ncbi:hypothetical protein BH10PSE19_BH10PSE19_10720 [soil metagenome]
MNPIIYITDTKVLEIPIIECHDALIDIKDDKRLRYGPPPECELTAECYTKIRKAVFEKLCQAQEKLPTGWFPMETDIGPITNLLSMHCMGQPILT